MGSIVHLPDGVLWLCLRLVWAQLLTARVEGGAAAAPEEATCRADATGKCNVSSEGNWRPRLRTKVYYGKEKKHNYGGPWVVTTFGEAGFDGWVEDDDWDLMWSHRQQEQGTPAQISELSKKLPVRPGRMVNHCQYFKAAGQKCYLASHLDVVMRHLGEPHSKRFLKTYHLMYPEQVQQWWSEMRADRDKRWLIKTCTGGASKGIEIVNHGSRKKISAAINTWSVAQEYMHKPLLSQESRKFHMRFYLLVTDWDPATAYLYDKGLVFRSHHDHRNMKKPTVQRDVFSTIKSDVEALELAAIWEEMGHERAEQMKARTRRLFADVLGTGVNETFGDSALLRERGYSCFDMFGADVMFDEAYEPFLLEFNCGPNMMIDKRGAENVELQVVIKEPLIQQIAAWSKARIARLAGLTGVGRGGEESLLTSFSRLL